MMEIVKGEIKKFFKNKKNLILLIIIMVFLISMNMINKKEKEEFIENKLSELQEAFKIGKAQASQITYLLEDYESELKKDNISEDRRNYLEEEILVWKEAKIFYNYESSRLNNISSALKQIQRLEEGKKSTFTEEELKSMYLKYSIDLMKANVDAYEKGYVDAELFKFRNKDINQYRRDLFKYEYIQEKNLDYSINPHTNTGINSTVKFFKPIYIIIIFCIIAFLNLDTFLGEVSEGSYKLIYSQPYKRATIFLGKLISVGIISILIFIGLLAVQFFIGTILNGIGDLNEIYIINKDSIKISFNKTKVFGIISQPKFIILSAISIVTIIIMNICFINMIAVFTDSISKTLGIQVIFIALTMIIKVFIGKQGIVQDLNPLSYIFVDDVFKGNINGGVLVGIILNLILICLFIVLSIYKFNKKDFLGVRE